MKSFPLQWRPTVNFNYQNPKDDIRFLLGHEPFESHLSYSFVRQYNDDDERIYSEMHTGDWWWETQEKLPEQATIVPVLIATDKTMLTQHHGDTSAWPVYMTIGNLRASDDSSSTYRNR
jgi:hypothetical protein